jgi:hypothetical protein
MLLENFPEMVYNYYMAYFYLIKAQDYPYTATNNSKSCIYNNVTTPKTDVGVSYYYQG